MWPFRRTPKDVPTFAVATTIGPDAHVRGDLAGKGGVRVDGRMEGSIDSDGPVVVGVDGSVEGSIRGRDVVVLGRVRGDVIATGHLEVGPRGKVLGEVSVESLKVHKGGAFRGMSRITGSEDPKATNPFGILPPIETSRTPEAPRVRTLPPPEGAVPPPAKLGDVAAPGVSKQATPAPPPVTSEERLAATGDEESIADAAEEAPEPPRVSAVGARR